MWHVINDKGEKIRTLNDGDKLKVIRKNSVEYVDNNVKINEGDDFIKVYPDNIDKKYNFLIYLLNFLEYETNILKHNNGKVLTVDYIAKDFNISKRQAINKINGLIKKNIIAKINKKNKIYFVLNPYFAYKGKRVNKESLNLF